jgi:mitochondrial enoyl-[acyl-carrier protein] reductase / trans-2-enoyl-CoA reductase
MLAVQYARFGAPAEVAELVEVQAPPAPGAGEALIEVERVAINPGDLLRLEGRYGNNVAALPAFAGAEGVGRVIEIGPGVTRVKTGDRVLLHQYFAKIGIWREKLVMSAASLMAMPEADPSQLAMLSVNPATAMLMLTDFVDLKPGDWVVQNAANSAVGHWLIKLAAIMGLSLINVVRREDAAAALRAVGAGNVIVDGPDLPERIGTITGAARPRLAIDAIGGEATQRLAASLVEGGTVVNYGLLSGEACRVAAHDTVFRDVSLRGFWLQRWWIASQQSAIDALYARLSSLVASGALSVPVEAVYPLRELKQALTHAGRPGRTGKIVMTVRD